MGDWMSLKGAFPMQHSIDNHVGFSVDCNATNASSPVGGVSLSQSWGSLFVCLDCFVYPSVQWMFAWCVRLGWFWWGWNMFGEADASLGHNPFLKMWWWSERLTTTPPLMAGGGKREWETRHLRPTCVWATESENGCSHLSRRTHACIIIIIVYKCKLSIHCCHHKITLQ